VAVLAVILNHAGFSLVGGGYIGVDIFFVISGYLITSIITSDMEAARFSLRTFYERRARRILPALIAMLVICFIPAWCWLLPNDLHKYSSAVLSILSFSSNIYFWRTIDYFSPSAEEQPLLHTWSLAVEEQFYVLFPLALWVLWRKLQRKHVALALMAFGTASLILAEWGWRHAIAPNFYLLPTRAWELLLGATIACGSPHIDRAIDRDSPAASVLAFIGIAAIVYSIGFFGPSTPTPSIYTALPVVGAALVIVFAKESNAVGRLLSKRLLVGIGLISYSAYLWHQPILAFARIREPNELGTLETCLLVLLTLAIGTLSWKFVEVPCRRLRSTPRRVFWRSGLALVVVGCASLFLTTNDGQRQRIPDVVSSKINARHTQSWWPHCEFRNVPGEANIETCEFGDRTSTTTIALWGDSHANMLYEPLDDQLKKQKLRGLVVKVKGCEVIPGVVENTSYGRKNNERCRTEQARLIEYLDRRVDALIVSLRWTYKLFPIRNEIDSLSFDNRRGGVEKNKYVEYCAPTGAGICSNEALVKQSAVLNFLDALAQKHFKTIVPYPAPEVGWHVAKYNWARYLSDGKPPEEIYTDHALYEKRHRFILSVFAQRGPHTGNLSFFRTDQALCHDDKCYAQEKGVPLYFDDDHLNYEGASRVVRGVLATVAEQRVNAGHSSPLVPANFSVGPGARGGDDEKSRDNPVSARTH
jgi:peptidoglycan/LPS O-acetylase OafA/YrhL